MPYFRKCPVTMVIVLLPLIMLLGMPDSSVLAVNLSAGGPANLPDSRRVGHVGAPEPDSRLTIIEGQIGRQPLYNILVSCGIAPSEVLSLTRSFKGLFDFRKAKPKDEYQVCLTPQKKLQKLLYKTGLTDQYVAVRTGNGAFHTYRSPVPLEKETVTKTFILKGSLYQTITGQGEHGSLASQFTEIFSWDVDFYLSPRRGDTIRILFEKYFMGGRFVKYGKILAAQYIGWSNQTFSAFYFDQGDQPDYYDENGIPLRKSFLRVPVKFGRRTSSFSIRRFHPISKKYKRHTGIDYSAPIGTPIFATAGGTVEFAGWRGGYGKLVIIRHPNGYQTYYGHCSRLLVRKGAHVKQGQSIARVGRTGQATGPHVHYEVRIKNEPVNPNTIKSVRGKPLPAAQHARFENMVQTRLFTMANHLYSQNH
jgi:hypothetical protein